MDGRCFLKVQSLLFFSEALAVGNQIQSTGRKDGWRYKCTARINQGLRFPKGG
jgi:hypothetical protein